MSPPIKIAHTQIIVTEFSDGEAVLIDVARKVAYQLNDTALLVWRGLEREESRAQIVATILATFDVTTEQAQTHLVTLLQTLAARQLILQN